MAKAVKLPSGNWRVNLFVGYKADGQRNYKSITGKTKKEAESKAAHYLQNMDHETEPMEMTVGEAIEQYINLRSAVLSPATVRGYRYDMSKYFQMIMKKPLKDLKPTDVQKAVNEDAKHYSPKTIRNMHGLLSSALAQYYPNFKLKTLLPQKIRNTLSIPTDADIQRMLSAVEGQRLEVAILLGACVGLRRSEISAIKVSDINIKDNTISINKAVVLDSEKEWKEKGTKTYYSTRTLEVPKFIIDKMLMLPRESQYVVGLKPSSITSLFCRLRNELGFDCRFHDLRHYSASIMLAMGIPDKYAMERMGHATTNMLKNVYQHTMDTETEKTTGMINNRMNNYFGNE